MNSFTDTRQPEAHRLKACVRQSAHWAKNIRWCGIFQRILDSRFRSTRFRVLKQALVGFQARGLSEGTPFEASSSLLPHRQVFELITRLRVPCVHNLALDAVRVSVPAEPHFQTSRFQETKPGNLPHAHYLESSPANCCKFLCLEPYRAVNHRRQLCLRSSACRQQPQAEAAIHQARADQQ